MRRKERNGCEDRPIPATFEQYERELSIACIVNGLRHVRHIRQLWRIHEADNDVIPFGNTQIVELCGGEYVIWHIEKVADDDVWDTYCTPLGTDYYKVRRALLLDIARMRKERNPRGGLS